MTEQLKSKEKNLPNYDLDLPAKATPESEMEHPVIELSPDEVREAVTKATHEQPKQDPFERVTAELEASQPAPANIIDAQLKQITARQEIKNLQRKEKAPVRSFSKLIHAPIVRQASEVAGQTVSRPSGLLGGGAVALLGTSGYLYLANHMGFPYNYGVFLALFAGGFALGLIIELLVHLATVSRRKARD
jgi:hypothetical protein